MNDDLIVPPAEVVEAVNKLEEFLDRTEIEKEGTMPVTNNPLSTAQPRPTNAGLHAGGPEYDLLDRQLAEIYTQSVLDRPLMHPETRETRIRWLLDHNAAYKTIASRLSSLTTKAGATPVVTKADEIRKAAAADTVQKMAEQRKATTGESIEAARSNVRRANPDLAHQELGQ